MMEDVPRGHGIERAGSPRQVPRIRLHEIHALQDTRVRRFPSGKMLLLGAGVHGGDLRDMPRQRDNKPALARATGPFHHYRAVAFGHGRQEVEQLAHGLAAAMDVGERILLVRLPAQLLHDPQIAKALDAAQDPTALVLQRGGRDADGNPLALRVDDVDHFVGDRAVRGQRLLQRTGTLANAGPKHLATPLADGLHAVDTGDLSRCLIERPHAPIGVHREHTVGHRIQHLAVEAVVHTIAGGLTWG